MSQEEIKEQEALNELRYYNLDKIKRTKQESKRPKE
ncbi:hypothetical protein CCAN12_10001 [Capnocytophaga canimorsus]|uniref:Uncharacterized protein n=1 Tax=Capnocytophaga canimorsus TaxID=28188 RepID=A0A0B7GZJ7_9FLAO|nr:hypothetical protein CCAN12_10001 [Capnocytophaga canimorsus]